MDVVEQSHPCGIGHHEVEKALHHIVGSHRRAMLLEVLSYLLGHFLGLLPCHLDEGEDHQCEVTFELTARLLQLHHLFGHLLPIQLFHGLENRLADCGFYLHNN